MKLLKSQKNSLFELIQKIDFFSHSQFTIIEDETMGHYKTTVQFNDDKNFYFNFNDSEYVDNLCVNYSPGKEQLIDSSPLIDWNKTLTYFNNWLYFLEREVTAPNLWEKFKTDILDINFLNNFNNEKFSFSEFNEISQKIESLKNSLISIPLIINQQNEIILRLDHLNKAAKDLGKFDWVSLFIGTIISVVIQLNVTPENASTLWELIRRIFNNYFLPK